MSDEEPPKKELNLEELLKFIDDFEKDACAHTRVYSADAQRLIGYARALMKLAGLVA